MADLTGISSTPCSLSDCSIPHDHPVPEGPDVLGSIVGCRNDCQQVTGRQRQAATMDEHEPSPSMLKQKSSTDFTPLPVQADLLPSLNTLLGNLLTVQPEGSNPPCRPLIDRSVAMTRSTEPSQPHKVSLLAVLRTSAPPPNKAIPGVAQSNMFVSLFTHPNTVKIVRTAVLGVTVATLLTSVALVVGATMGPLLIVAAVGLTLGALAGWFANGLSESLAEKMTQGIADKPVGQQLLIGSTLGGLVSGLHGARSRGALAIAAASSARTLTLGVRLGCPTRGVAGAVATASAVGTADTVAQVMVSNAMRWSAALGGSIGGFVLNSVTDSTKVGESAGKGAVAGGLIGRVMDSHFLLGIAALWSDCFYVLGKKNRYAAAGAMTYQMIANRDNPGYWEQTGATVGGIAGGLAGVINIRTGMDVTQPTKCLKMASGAMFASLLTRLRAVGNIILLASE